QGVEFFEHPGLAHERIAVRDIIIGGRAVLWLARNSMADRAAAPIDIDPEHARKEVLIDDLRGRAFIITVGPIEKSIGWMKEHAAAIVPGAVPDLIDEH